MLLITNFNFPHFISEQSYHEIYIVRTLPLCLAGSGTNEFSAFALENSKYRPRDEAIPMYIFMIATGLTI